MGPRWVRLLVGAIVLFALPVSVAAAKSPTIASVQLDGVVDPFEASYVSSAIDEAAASNAQAVLLTIDTPGGLDSSMRKIIKAILNSPVPVVCYVSPQGARAASAGTFILIGCPIAAMAPGTNVGAAHPVGISGAIAQEKVINDAVAYIRSLAEGRGRNADWAEKAVRESESISAEEALRIKVIDLIAADVATLLSKIDGRSVGVGGDRTLRLSTAGAHVEKRAMGLGSRLLHTLLEPGIAFILFYLGLILLVVELLHPGISVPGILGVLSLVAAFTAFGMLPVQLVGILLLLASAVFFLLELKHPGLGIPTVGGLASLILGGLLLFDPRVPGAAVSPWLIAPVALAAGLFFVFVVRAALRIRSLPVGYGPATLIGQEGVAVTDLDPVGSVRVALENWTAESIAGALPRGTGVRVVETEGLKLKVEAAEPQPEEIAARVKEGS